MKNCMIIIPWVYIYMYIDLWWGVPVHKLWYAWISHKGAHRPQKLYLGFYFVQVLPDFPVRWEPQVKLCQKYVIPWFIISGEIKKLKFVLTSCLQRITNDQNGYFVHQLLEIQYVK